MPILPYRVERLALDPDGAPLVVYRIQRLAGGGAPDRRPLRGV
jgi:hypothetical protein